MQPDNNKHVVLLSNSVIETDPRVSKFARTLCDAGWSVTTVGLPPLGHAGGTLPWSALHIDLAQGDTKPPAKPVALAKLLSGMFLLMAQGVKPFSESASNILSKVAIRTQRRQNVLKRALYYWWLGFGLRVLPKGYQSIFWKSNTRYNLFLETAMVDVGAVDLWIANDWDMLPIALALKAEKGGKVLYDSHEYAVEQFIGDKQWRQFMQPLVKAVENSCIHQVDAISSVSTGLCKALKKRYALEKTPHCIRNVPPYQKYAFRACKGPRIVLYQGLIGPGRGLKKIIDSTRFWHKGLHLVIRGPEGRAGYVSQLKQLIYETGSEIKISIEAPVPFAKMVAKAHEADIGLLALPCQSVHNRHALPNKIFEYMMAGLALCVTSNEDMANIVAHYRNGTLIEEFTPASIADAVNSMDAVKIDACKHASLQAAKALNWEEEQAAFLALCASAYPLNGKTLISGQSS
ncbi:MAG: hypothetical protein COA85_06375 [Robiginitomaculum sp.]|nr:MAG: hypothetical protein COA85_06375 [Robiginitomaculum sp.]